MRTLTVPVPFLSYGAYDSPDFGESQLFRGVSPDGHRGIQLEAQGIFGVVEQEYMVLLSVVRSMNPMGMIYGLAIVPPGSLE